ncbi:hypothetical protein N7462_003525 [Penicillium macrosclerotiorum]|uniref:uncharacterized protein n=1 Tax=Penicillium macrosclerotiorum TaxID=303699 RepID=UPI002549267C|nr:uncharacterized protein N7462_003525 [Penicillium macrosclerotiorum]KAJ5689133.1 hypothetical protein N7462_003525 [Penicillium macrosclerotiorum]
MAGGNAEKGQRYIASLDQARAQGKWQDVPELIRKVTKHAPQRTCVIQTATAESRVVAYLQKKTSSESSETPNLPELIPALLTTIENNDGSPQEIFQAQVCLGWIHWTLNEPGLAAARLPKDLAATLEALTNEGKGLSTWTEVCLVKGCFIKGMAQFTVTGIDETLETFASLIPWLGSLHLDAGANPQFLNWTEALLSKGAVMASDEAVSTTPYSDPRHVEIALRMFRLWASLPTPKGIYEDPAADLVPRKSMYQSYYAFLTIVLQDDLIYTAPNDGPDRPQLASELRRVESICENQLLREVKFPTASSNNFQVEAWVEQVILNWQVLCGPHWQDSDLGEGGQNAVGRNVLDILYRAATKTYHSHLILRRLFHVHSALADFDLAIQALDSYIEIVTAAKERAEKSAELGELERDEILLQTLSEGVTLLSCLGSFDEAEKAKNLTGLIKEYIKKQATSQANDKANGKLLLTQDPHSPSSPEIANTVLAAAYRAVGVGLANWASYTPQNEARDEIRGEAVQYLVKSIAPELGNELSYSSLYTLSLVLAENRDLDAAINYVKTALTSHGCSDSSAELSKERDLVPLWHLLALLLSAKNEFDIAERSCEAAFEQFPSELIPKSLHERRSDRRSSRQSSHSKERGPKRSLVSRLQGREKERILQTRITQLAFIEVLEGPEAAVNQSGQLLGLFGTLFSDLNLDSEGTKPKTEHLVPPKSSAGTTKSFRSSIFSRSRMSQLPDRRAEPSVAPPVPSIPNAHTGSTDAPAIQVTDEDQGHERASTLGRTDSKKLKKRSSSFHRNERPRIQEPPLPNGTDSPDMVGIAVSGNSSPISAAHSPTGKQPLQPVAHNIHHKQQPAPAGHENQPPVQDIRLPFSHRFDSPTKATTRFSYAQSQKHALGLLVKIWLIIAGLYRRASLFDDAREACQEAMKQSGRVETLTASFESSARAFTKRGWDNAKSSEELWADVYAEQALLSQAQSNPHQAIKLFEDALLRCPDHPTATIGLANLLLDVWDQKLPLEPSNADVDLDISRVSLLSEMPKPNSAKAVSIEELKAPDVEIPPPAEVSPSPHDVDPKHLHRLAARDRAYALLSALTKQGSSWDNSEAWYALSRAYEAGEQVDKLKDVLWWCIELEDRRPIRHWSNIGSGLYVL